MFTRSVGCLQGGFSYSKIPLTKLTKSPQTFCSVPIELADSACYCSFNTILAQPLYREYEHRLDDVPDPGVPISVYTTVEFPCVSSN